MSYRKCLYFGAEFLHYKPQNSDFSYWGPHLLHIPAFIDVMIVMYIVMRERGPGGSLEKQLFSCCVLPSSLS